jgi:chromosome segregation ATPase
MTQNGNGNIDFENTSPGMNYPRGYVSGGGLVPVPDPTRLTTEQLVLSIKSLRELLESRIASIESAVVEVTKQLDARQKIIEDADKNVKCLFDEKIKNVALESNKLKATTDEIFERINVQFTERDKRTEQLAIASSTAIAAALQAAKEAVGAQNTSNSIAIAKSESSTIESIRQLQTLFNTAITAMKDQISDIKSRLDKGEGQVKGVSSAWGFVVGLVGMAFGVLGIIGFIVKMGAQ